MDGTFLESKNPQEDTLYRYLHDNPDIMVVFNTGRNIELIYPLLAEMAIPNPTYIIGDVGASVLQHKDGVIEPVQPLQNDITNRWNRAVESISDLQHRLEELELQDQPQERRKSFYVTGDTIPYDLVDELKTRDCDVLHSNEIYLDILPKDTNKGSTLKALIEHLGVDKERVLVAGDTLNDLSMYQHGFKGVVLGNSEEPLKEAARGLDNAYYSDGHGTDGIYEALKYFGVIPKDLEQDLKKKEFGTSDLVMVYHRMPFQESRENGQFVRKKHASPNGILPTLLGFFNNKERGSWVAWTKAESRNPENFERHAIVDAEKYENLRVARVPLTQEDVRIFYEVFSKEAFWPMLHSFHEQASFDHEHWGHFLEINEIFAQEAAKEAAEGATVWIHDYNLWMVPQYLRQLRPDVKIAFYHHTPFPSADIFNMIPWRHDIISSLLQCDYVGFHIPIYVDHFVNTVRSNYKAEIVEKKEAAPRFKTYGCAIGVDRYGVELQTELNTVRLGAHPVGINCQYVAELASSDRIEKLSEQIRKEIGEDCKLIVSIERTDYTKGPVDKLKAFEYFLEKHPEMQGKVTLFMVCTPPAKGMKIYEDIAQDIAYHVGLINGRYGSYKWTPIRYVNRMIPFEDVIAYYRAGDIGWVTPLRDGLNLVAKEYVMAQDASGSKGALILSEYAGAAVELHGAFLVNPYDKRDMSETIIQALNAPENERASRLNRMANIIRGYDVNAWGRDFLDSVQEADTVTVDKERPVAA